MLHVFNNKENAKAYLSSELFTNDVVGELKGLLKTTPEVKIYETI